jgi:hypothetical protein
MKAFQKEILRSNFDRLSHGIEDLRKALTNFQEGLDGLTTIIQAILEQETEEGSA